MSAKALEYMEQRKILMRFIQSEVRRDPSLETSAKIVELRSEADRLLRAASEAGGVTPEEAATMFFC